MPELDKDSTDSLIDEIDTMARAAYLWVRQQTFEQRFIGLPISASDESDLAAGFIAGLRVRLTLEDTESLLLAYAYALMSGERHGATALAQELVGKGAGLITSCSGYAHGLKAARELLNTDGLDANTALRHIAPKELPYKEH